MNILAVIQSHDASICLLEDGEVKLHTKEERLSKRKHDSTIINSLHEFLKTYDKEIHVVAVGDLIGAPTRVYTPEQLHYMVEKINNKNNYHPVFTSKCFQAHTHHLMHAAIAFYNSGFEESLCVVLDGHGNQSEVEVNRKLYRGAENQSVYKFSYPCEHELIFQYIDTDQEIEDGTVDTIVHTNNDQEIVLSNVPFSLGHLFRNLCTDVLGLNPVDAGKAMGLASYGSSNSIKNFPNFIDVLDTNKLSNYYNLKNENNFFKLNDIRTFQQKADFSKFIQDKCSQTVLDIILKSVEKTGIKNVCLSGGYALNISTNSFLLKHLPKDIRLYVEPVSADDGISIGLAKYFHHSLTQDKTIRKQKNIFYGFHHQIKIPDNITKYNTNHSKVAQLISEGKYVAVYEGRSESGPRALGHRSLLFDPTLKNSKDLLNLVKKREWFRPFAGSILQEDFDEWFYTLDLDESKHMMYMFQVKEDKKDLIPGIVHVDGSCRVQTITEAENYNLYKITEEFKKIKNVPIVMNTSFNLSGHTMVETVEDAIYTLHNSKIEYCFFPEIETLIYIPNL